MKRLQMLMKILGLLVIYILVIIGLSIPVAKLSERKIKAPGIQIDKVVFRHANVITF